MGGGGWGGGGGGGGGASCAMSSANVFSYSKSRFSHDATPLLKVTS